MLKQVSNLIRLGSAKDHTRADAEDGDFESNPIYLYEVSSTRMKPANLGSAAVLTRADDETGDMEQVPIFRWETAGVRH